MTDAPASRGLERPTFELARFASGLTLEQLPAEVIHQARRVLLDTLGCALGGAGSEIGRLTAAWVRGAGAGPAASIIGTGDGTSVPLAAYANARMAGALDADDTFPSSRQLSHHASTTVAAALAVAEQRNLQGGDLLVALVAGYEVGARISNAMVPAGGPSRILRAGWGPGPTLAATAAAARAMGQAPGPLAHAYGISGTHIDPPPLQWTQVRPAPMTKSADGGWQAMAGVMGAEMADLGMTGYDRILDGESGLWLALGYGSCDVSALVGGLGTEWLILDAAFKAWPCQYWMHHPLTALRRILRDQALTPGEVERIALFTNDKSASAKFVDPEPAGEIDRSFSLPHAAAMLVLGVPPGPRWFDDAIFESYEARRLRSCVAVEIEPESRRFEEWIVRHQIRDVPARAVVRARGRTFETEARLGLGGPWSPETRLSDDDLVAKFREQAAPLRSTADWSARVDRVIAWVMETDRQGSVDELVRLLTGS